MGRIKSKISWGLFAFSSIMIGLYPIVYFVIDHEFGLLSNKTDALLADTFWNIGFYGHITLGGLSLFIGWMQFSKKLRKQKIEWHRKVGYVYTVAATISGLCAIYIGIFATGGIVAIVGFMTLGVLWVISTVSALVSIKKGDVRRHENLMIISYACCFAAVTLRLWLPICDAFAGGFIPGYRIVAWLCWVPNVLAALLIINRKNKRLEKFA